MRVVKYHSQHTTQMRATEVLTLAFGHQRSHTTQMRATEVLTLAFGHQRSAACGREPHPLYTKLVRPYLASSFAASPLSGPSTTSKIERSDVHERSEPRVTQRGRSDHSGRSASPSRLCVCGSRLTSCSCSCFVCMDRTRAPFPRCTAAPTPTPTPPPPPPFYQLPSTLCTSPLPRSSQGAHRPRPSD
jgi:hypothetical protein